MTTPTPTELLSCESTRYGRGSCSELPPRWEVAYRSSTTQQVTERHPACFVHGLAEVDRHYGSAGIAPVELRELQWPITTQAGLTLWACCTSSVGPVCEHRAAPQ